jgi:hypothetical protein
MPYYSLRITTNDDFNFLEINKPLENFIKENNIDEYLFNQEVGNETEKPHYQGGFQSIKTEQALRKQFKKHFPTFKGNQCYSLKGTKLKSKEPCDRGVYNYCAKEYTTMDEAHASFTHEEIIEFRKEWEKNKDLIKQCKVKYKKEQDNQINKILKDIWKDNIVHNREPHWILCRICTLVGKLDEPVHTAYIEKIYKKALQKCGPHYLSAFYFEQTQRKLLPWIDHEKVYVEYTGKLTNGNYIKEQNSIKNAFYQKDELDD